MLKKLSDFLPLEGVIRSKWVTVVIEFIAVMAIVEMVAGQFYHQWDNFLQNLESPPYPG